MGLNDHKIIVYEISDGSWVRLATNNLAIQALMAADIDVVAEIKKHRGKQ